MTVLPVEYSIPCQFFIWVVLNRQVLLPPPTLITNVPDPIIRLFK
nr:MAG TPA: hypothetical protein [Bacteriophage sp.]